MKILRFGFLLCLAIFAAGCPNKPALRFDNTLVNQINKHLETEQTRYNNAITGGRLDEAKRIRDAVIEDAISYMDSNYQDFINSLNTRRSAGNFIADAIELSAGTAIGIAKGERPNQIIGIALTAFRGGRKSADLNFYKEQTTPILINKMDDNRAKVYGMILQKKPRDVNDYQIQEAVKDLVAYYNAGTLVRAFSELAKDTAAKAKSNEDKVLRLKGLKSLDSIPSPEEVIESIPIFDQMRELDAQLKDASAADKATKRLGLIYHFILSDTNFKATVDELRKKNELKASFTKIDAKQNLDGREAWNFVRAVYAITEGNIDLTKQLGSFFTKSKTE